MMPTQERLRHLLDYDPETGVFTWLVRRGRAAAGSVAGCVHSEGYVRVKVDGATHVAHRLAWLFVYGEWPKQEIDHINRVKTDNRIANLRDVSRRENALNVGVFSNSTSGVTGVYWCKREGKWLTQITVFGRDQHLGYFADFNDAVAARHAAEMEVHGSQGGA